MTINIVRFWTRTQQAFYSALIFLFPKISALKISNLQIQIHLEVVEFRKRDGPLMNLSQKVFEKGGMNQCHYKYRYYWLGDELNVMEDHRVDGLPTHQAKAENCITSVT